MSHLPHVTVQRLTTGSIVVFYSPTSEPGGIHGGESQYLPKLSLNRFLRVRTLRVLFQKHSRAWEPEINDAEVKQNWKEATVFISGAQSRFKSLEPDRPHTIASPTSNLKIVFKTATHLHLFIGTALLAHISRKLTANLPILTKTILLFSIYYVFKMLVLLLF